MEKNDPHLYFSGFTNNKSKYIFSNEDNSFSIEFIVGHLN